MKERIQRLMKENDHIIKAYEQVKLSKKISQGITLFMHGMTVRTTSPSVKGRGPCQSSLTSTRHFLF